MRVAVVPELGHPSEDRGASGPRRRDKVRSWSGSRRRAVSHRHPWLAEAFGADALVNARTVVPASTIRDAFGGADVVIATAAVAEPLRAAFAPLRRGGRLVCVGLPADIELRLPVFETVVGGMSVIRSIVVAGRDLAEVFELHAAG
jgi:D-arabinose 1-dehydrogenase-like Zn-dependent alcohol dehydrogenase